MAPVVAALGRLHTYGYLKRTWLIVLKLLAVIYSQFDRVMTIYKTLGIF